MIVIEAGRAGSAFQDQRPDWHKVAWAIGGSLVLHMALLTFLPPLVDMASNTLPAVLEVRLVQHQPARANPETATAQPARAAKPAGEISSAVAQPARAPTMADPAPAAQAPAAASESAPAPRVPHPAESATVTPPDVRAAYLNNPRPPYPLAARRLGLEGRVVLRAEILENGSCGQIAVAQGSGHEILDEAALRAVKQWYFVPARRGGDAVAAWVEIPVSFKLATDS